MSEDSDYIIEATYDRDRNVLYGERKLKKEYRVTGKELTVKYCGSNIRHETKASAMKSAKKLGRLYEPNRYTVCKCLSCSYWHVKQIKLMDEVEEGSF